MVSLTKLFLFTSLCVALSYAVDQTHKELSSLTIPLFMWSGKQIFSSPNTEVFDTITPTDIEQAFLNLLNVNKQQSKLITNEVSQVEAVILFAEPELRTDQIPLHSAEFTGLKSRMDNSVSSLLAPYATLNGKFSLLESPLNHVSDEATQTDILVVREGESTLFNILSKLSGVQNIATTDFTNYASSNNIFSNGKTELIVVCFDKETSFGAHDSLMSQFSDLVSELSNGNFVAIYSGNTPALSNMKWAFDAEDFSSYSRNEMYLVGEFVPIYPGNTTMPTQLPTYINYFPSVILESFIIVAILIAMVFTGTCAIFSLQTPDRWEMPKIKRDM
eukprot:TRINITY_DN23959_c0_g1_i1.p1 TRINITY_DN23959_c0_g1~~TRINITY_DN23959_c0_g1_i1.p1  ORF type:complete len:332 (-),score=117.24 TRINITY_DN23959_c0_g1_i1:46-1041(-)